MHNDGFKLYVYDLNSRIFSENKIEAKDLNTENSFRPRHLTFFRTPNLSIENHKIYGLITFVSTNTKQKLHKILIKEEEGKFIVHSHQIFETQYQIVKIFSSLAYCKSDILDYFLYQTKTGEIYKFNVLEDNLPIAQSFNRNHPFVVHYEVEIDEAIVTIGLTQNQKLYIDNKLITSECTSLHVYLDFVLFTTLSSGMSHLMYIYQINDEKLKMIRVIQSILFIKEC